ncbi:hypothetical protein [Croceivirga sp. JEA036]|uniref:hypothetical protein n=1 Tax=Croceivirga sp. JEA036 TaxID=2721162 RepID=UPI00143B579D|nr:hypothetical protein [Croceivirga sp. JEA036]NJB36364.1 hypothetical protein [Croceivirga sp. JEA036]
MLYIFLILLFTLFVILLVRGGAKAYTHEQWEQQCKEDFRKYGPVPEDKDIFN